MSKFGAPMEDDHEDGHKPIKHNEVKPPRELVPAPEGEEEPSPDPGSNGRSMKIKIKISPPAPPQPLPEPNNSKETSFSQTCCGKLFSSGKAWGGHKRHHALKESEPQLQPRTNKFEDVEKKKKKKKKVGVIKAGDVKVSNGGKPECCLCGKNFPSMNSLFGHMRFHRDRGWKGIKPPTKHSSLGSSPKPSGSSACLLSTSPSNSSDDSTGLRDDGGLGANGGIVGADLMGSLSIGWTTKGRRGRVGSCTFDYSPLPVLVPSSFEKMFCYPVRFSGDETGKDEDDNNAVVVPNKRMRKEEGGVADVDNNGGEEKEDHVFELDLNRH